MISANIYLISNRKSDKITAMDLNGCNCNHTPSRSVCSVASSHLNRLAGPSNARRAAEPPRCQGAKMPSGKSRGDKERKNKKKKKEDPFADCRGNNTLLIPSLQVASHRDRGRATLSIRYDAGPLCLISRWKAKKEERSTLKRVSWVPMPTGCIALISGSPGALLGDTSCWRVRDMYVSCYSHLDVVCLE